MTMKKKILTTLSVVLILGLAALGILAYLMDEDSDVNVMTLGNVSIDQIEQERDDEGNLVDFSSKWNSPEKKPLFPAVYPGNSTSDSIPWAPKSEWVKNGDQAWKVVADNENVVDKFVTVENTGKSDAFLRTVIAYEGNEEYGPEGAWIHIVHNGSNVNPAIDISKPVYINIDGVDYTVYAYTYPVALASGNTSIPSLKQVYMDHMATNDVVAYYGDTYDILVLSQAIQADGFGDAITALNTGYAAITQENKSTIEGWFAGVIEDNTKEKWDGTVDTTWYNTTDKTFTLSTAEQLAGVSALSANGNTFSGKTIVLSQDMDLNGKKWTPIKQFSGTFDGANHTVSNFTLDGTSGRAGFIQNLGQYPATVKNLTLSDVNGIAGSNKYFGIVAANGHTSILENVHVVDCKIETTNKEAWVGGVYGYFNWTSASNCTVENLEIDATDGAMFLGGFSGNMDQDLSINNVDIIGLKIKVDATNGACQVGGFTGQTQTGHRQPTFNNCDVTGLDIVAKGEVQLGGFVGDAGAHTIANNCTVEGKIDASGVTDDRSFIGGFITDSGWNNNESNKGGHKLTNCSADVDIVTGGSTAGGFIGSTTAYHADGGNRNMPITMTNCKATGTVTVASGKTATIGGFAGEAERGTFKNCSTTSDTFIGKIWDGYTLNDDGNGTLTVTK